jgi:hypothetical protein
MYTRVTKDQFEIRDGVYIHIPTEAEFAPNPNSEGSMVIYTGNIGSKLASGELFAYVESPTGDESSLGGSQPASGQSRGSRFGRVTNLDGCHPAKALDLPAG